MLVDLLLRIGRFGLSVVAEFWEKKQPKKKVKAKKLTPRQINAAKRKFDKYPSAVANAWAKKQPR